MTKSDIQDLFTKVLRGNLVGKRCGHVSSFRSVYLADIGENGKYLIKDVEVELNEEEFYFDSYGDKFDTYLINIQLETLKNKSKRWVKLII